MSPKTENPDSGLGAKYVSLWGILVTAVYLIAVAVILFYTLLAFWPSTSALEGTAVEDIYYFGAILPISAEIRLLIIVGLAGALGSLIHALRSFYWYVGQRQLVWSWLAKYVLQPLVGTILGLVFYFVIRGGFFSPSATIQETSPFSFVAMSGLVGMFAEQAVLKLKQIADTLFAKPEPGENASPQETK